MKHRGKTTEFHALQQANLFARAFEPAVASNTYTQPLPRNVLFNQGWHCSPKHILSQLFSIMHPCQVVLAYSNQADWNNLQLAFITEPPLLLLAAHFVFIKWILTWVVNKTSAGVQRIRCSLEIVKAENKIIREKAISTFILPLRIWKFVFVGLGKNSFHLCEPTCGLKCYSPRMLPIEMETSRWSFIS